jgi:hypothetical protein
VFRHSEVLKLVCLKEGWNLYNTACRYRLWTAQTVVTGLAGAFWSTFGYSLSTEWWVGTSHWNYNWFVWLLVIDKVVLYVNRYMKQEPQNFLLIHCTGRFIMFSGITNIYNKKTKGPTLMEFFTATGKQKTFILTARDVRCVHHGWHGTHRYDIQVIATHASTCWHGQFH